jgi:hypothetical protein
LLQSFDVEFLALTVGSGTYQQGCGLWSGFRGLTSVLVGSALVFASELVCYLALVHGVSVAVRRLCEVRIYEVAMV